MAMEHTLVPWYGSWSICRKQRRRLHRLIVPRSHPLGATLALISVCRRLGGGRVDSRLVVFHTITSSAL